MEYGCIGERLPHSFSKEIHEKIGNYRYELRELSPGELGAFLEERDFKAINVTIPYKQSVIPYLYKLDETAGKIGAVNTIVNRNGILYGYNTDFYGMTALINRGNISFSGKKVLILGTGGTSKTAAAVSEYLRAGEIHKVSRQKSENTLTYDEASCLHGDTEIIINTTPVGMYPNTDGSPIDINLFPRLEAVIDAVYNPLGLYMLVAQAVRAYEIFMDKSAPYGLTERIFRDIYRDKQNIVLTGMPGSGKTTIGRILAEKLNREFIDTDDEIIKTEGKTISDIFGESGEEYFRDIEAGVIKEVSKSSGKVIATGGGAILREENINNLKLNGKIYFLNRSPELLIPTSDRPLAGDVEAIYKRYSERINKYFATADEIIPDDIDADTVAKDIERRHYNEASDN